MMTGYYTAVVLLCCLSLGVLGILVYENARLSPGTKKRFYDTCIVVALSSLAELGSVLLNGAPMWTVNLHILVKCMDYILTPLVAVCFVRQMFEENKTVRLLAGLVALNAAFQMVSVFTGWTFYMDGANYYHHGSLYILYIGVYCLCFVAAIYSLFAYGSLFNKENRMSLFAIALLIGLGIVVQELGGGSVRTSTLALSMGCILYFIHYSEFRQLTSDADIQRKEMLLERDPLTGMLSRYAYNEALRPLEHWQKPDERLLVFSIDVNGLKHTNDTFGHLAGDELIRGAADCIMAALSPYGKCFRIGCDEFTALLYPGNTPPEELKAALNRELARWSGELVGSVSLSCGYAAGFETPDGTVDGLIKLADKRMYREKSLYYQQQGIDRRVQRAAYNALCESCVKILKVDLLKDTFETIKADGEEPEEKACTGVFSRRLQEIAQSGRIHPEDREVFLRATDRDTLRSWFLAGNRQYRLHYRRQTGGDFHAVVMELLPVNDFTGEHQEMFLYVRDMD